MRFAFSHARENLVRQASAVTVASGTVMEGYGTANVGNHNWAHPLRIEETTLDLRFDFGTAVLPELPILGNSNLTVAAQWQGHPTDTWGAPDVSTAFGIPTMGADGVFTSPFIDMSGSTAKRWWRLLVTANAHPIIIGELWLGEVLRTIDTGFTFSDLDRGSLWKSAVHETDFGVELTYAKAPRLEEAIGVFPVDNDELAELEAWAQTMRGAARPSMVIPRVDVNDAWMVRMTDRFTRRPAGGGDGWIVTMPLRMVSRGMHWVEPDEDD